MGVESYAHKAAKAVFASWLRGMSREVCKGDDCVRNPRVDFGERLSWRVNRDGPHFGVWVEYPIGHRRFGNSEDLGSLSRLGREPVWDEVSEEWKNRPPSFEELCSIGEPPEFIVDVAIQHKGALIAVVEVVHKNPPNDKKISAFHRMGLLTWVVPATWILGQVRRPSHLPLEFFQGNT